MVLPSLETFVTGLARALLVFGQLGKNCRMLQPKVWLLLMHIAFEDTCRRNMEKPYESSALEESKSHTSLRSSRFMSSFSN